MAADGASNTPAPAPRPAARALAPRSAISNTPEVEKTLLQVRKLVADVDEARVQRAYRHWLDWVLDRGKRAPLALAVLAGDQLAAIAPDAARAVAQIDEPVVELGPRRRSGEDTPWTRITHDLGTLHRIILIRDPAALAADWPVCAMLRRECAGFLHFDGVDGSAIPAGLFAQLPLGTVTVRRGGGDANPPAPRGRQRSYVLDVAEDAPLAAILERALPVQVIPSLRLAMLSQDLADLAAAVQGEDATINQRSDENSTSETARASRSEEERLLVEVDAVGAARTEIGTDVKQVVAALRQSRAGFDPAVLLEIGTPESFAHLVQQLEQAPDEELSELVASHPKRNWWRDTPFRHVPALFSAKQEAQLRPEVLQNALKDVEYGTVRAIGKAASDAIADFNRALADADLTFEPASGGISAILRGHMMQRTHFDSFLINRPPPPGGALPDSQLAQQIKETAAKAFSAFGQSEVRAFRIERERKGFVGRLTEARSAIFGVYFLLLIGLRFLRQDTICQRASELSKEPARGYELWCAIEDGLRSNWLSYIMLGLIVFGLFFNIYSQPRKERIQFADRVEAKLEELRNRLSAFLDRLVKDQLSALETRLNDQADAIDAALARLQASLRTRLEALRGPVAPPPPRELTPLGRRDLDAQARALAGKIGDDFAAEYAAAVAG
ncbi:hypothetical protein ACFQ1E_20270 [Sphingomonas canadensis]|uniref:Uncharacterized protein n=1 Tax=Sphingomonas canadensis TaxID=1219257 RepID=A0ABW3HBX1_9SPHN|nr:hypothetical protein [Sphingomonas canadensis]MCW3838406.1 hypothetical protein [Sphingomonas canadensis]